MRRVMCITGVRSEYFLQRPIFQAIMDHPELELELVVAGAHLSPMHGSTVKDIEADGFPVVAKIESLLYSDRDAARIKGAANQMQVLSHVIDERRPDLLLAPTDREETMLLALYSTYISIPCVQYGAGDRSGHVDDMVRHAVSRLSHVLLAPHEEAEIRLVNTGEDEWRVHNVGSAGLDRIRATPLMDRGAMADALGVQQVDATYLIAVQHPVSESYRSSGDHMHEILTAVDRSGHQCFVSYPSSDPGSQAIIEVIERYADHPKIHTFRNIPDQPFVNLLRNASCLIGNSSMALVEAPMLQLPAIMVGNRQVNRAHTDNVLFVAPDADDISRALNKAMTNQEFRQQLALVSSPYGDGNTGPRIAITLAKIDINSALLNKSLTY